MARELRIRGVRRKEIDEDKLALAFLLLAKAICEDQAKPDPADTDEDSGDTEAA